MKVANFVAAMRRAVAPVEWQTPATEDDCTVRRSFMSSERYLIDFADDFKSEGWEQFDTDQDASYFGVWVNRRQFLTLNYAEGDWTLVECHDQARYDREIKRMCEFYGEGFIAKAIESDGSITEYRQDRADFLKA